MSLLIFAIRTSQNKALTPSSAIDIATPERLEYSANDYCQYYLVLIWTSFSIRGFIKPEFMAGTRAL